MSLAGTHCMVDDPQILTSRLGRFVRERLSAKDLATAARCDIRTAENIRRGVNWPIARHWVGLIATFGEDLTEAVFHPEKAAARLKLEVALLETELAATRAALDDLQGALPRGAQVQARDEDRPSVAARAKARRPATPRRRLGARRPNVRPAGRGERSILAAQRLLKYRP